MKKRLAMAVSAAVLALGLFGLFGCAGNGDGASGATDGGASASTSPSGEVSVYSREDGSGTRGAFIELFGIEEKDANGDKVDLTTPTAAITNSTSVMMTSVAGDANAIGYISLGSLNNTVKALSIDGAEATAENVKSGTYKVARPFNIVTKDGVSDVAQDFIDYIMSSDGQKVVEENGCISVADNADSYKASGKSGKIVIAGSSSVTPVMAEAGRGVQGSQSRRRHRGQPVRLHHRREHGHRGNLRHRHGLPRAQGLRERREGHGHRPGRHRGYREPGCLHRRAYVRPGEGHLHRRADYVGRCCSVGLTAAGSARASR